MKILETERTVLREVVADDAAFILNLLNQPSFIKYIGDRNVRTIDAARAYIGSRFTKSYQQNGFAMWAIELKETGGLIGLCGFVRRDGLPDADIGFALLPQFEKEGYAFETASAALDYGRNVLKFPRILAITSKDNAASQKLLEKIGLRFERLICLSDDAEELKLFSSEATAA